MIEQDSHTDGAHGPKYEINIEGTTYGWDSDTITVAQIIDLGHLPADQGVIEIDQDNNQRTLAADEVVQLRPGLGFSKRVRFQRG